MTTENQLQACWSEIRRLGLEKHIAEIDANGLTVIPPELATPNGLSSRLLDRLLDIAERKSGTRPDLEMGSTHVGYKSRHAATDGDSPFGELLQSLLLEGEVFEEALMNPVLLAITTYLCGYSMILSGMTCFMKGPNKTDLNLHSDTFLPAPWPAQAMLGSATYVLTDFDQENGSTAYVPGSHKLCRPPRGAEINMADPCNPDARAVKAPAGSLIVWHGHTWHGAFARKAEGLRVSMNVLMSRPYMRTEEDLADRIPQQTLDRNDARFAILAQQGIFYGFTSGEDAARRSARAQKFMLEYYEESGGMPWLNPFEMDLYN